MDEYDERVARGVRFLDAVKPDWRKSVNLDILNLESPCRCIIGQVFGDYSSLFFWIPIPETEDYIDMEFACALGFNAKNDWEDDIDLREIELAWLENAWRDVLKTV